MSTLEEYFNSDFNHMYFWLFTDRATYEAWVNAKDDQARKDFLEAYNNRFIEYIKKHENKVNTLFGMCASVNTTSMVAEEVLIKQLTLALPANFPLWGLIVIAIGFNLILDKWLFDVLAETVDSRFFLLNYRENFKFLILAITAGVLMTFGHYVIPIVLLLFTASYFINYTLQLNKLGDTINKIFFTLDGNGIPRLFEGFRAIDGIALSNAHLNFIKFGSIVSLFYVIAVIGIFATWVFPILPVIGGFAIGAVAVSVILAIYGITYGFLAARGWADLMKLDARLRMDYEGSWGIFSPRAWLEFFANMCKGVITYSNYIATQIRSTHALGAFIFILSELGLVSLKLSQMIFCILVLPATFNTISIGGDTIGKYLGDEVGKVLTYGAFTANTPFAVKSALNVALPKEPTQHALTFWDKVNEWRMRIFCQVPNAAVSAILANGATVPEPVNNVEDLNIFNQNFFSNQYVRAGGGFATSTTAAENGIKNAHEENHKQKLVVTQWEEKKKSTTQATTNESWFSCWSYSP